MARKIARLLIFCLVIFWLDCSKDSNPVQSSAPTTNEQAIAQQTHDLINVYRLSQELPALTFNNDVANVALEHSRNMAAGRVPFSHDGFDQRMSTLAKKIKFNTAAENVAFNQGYQDPAAIAVEGWLMSTGHLANITSDFDVTGIGVATNEKKGYYFTQIFVKTN